MASAKKKKNQLLPKLSNKYKLIWEDSSLDGVDRENDKEIETDIVDLIASLSGLEEKFLV